MTTFRQKSGAEQDDRRRYSDAILLGTNIAVGMGIFSLGGYYADAHMNTSPLCTVCGMILGMSYGGYQIALVIRQINAGEKNSTRDSHSRGHPGETKAPFP